MKIVYLDTYPLGDISLEPIACLGDFTGYANTLPGEVIERAEEADVVIVNKVNITRKEIDALPRLRLICVSATGVNNVDTRYAARKGIPVKNVAGYSSGSVTETVLGMVLTLLRNLSYYDRYVKDGSYASSGLIFHMGRPVSEIRGKTWGIIGLGTIGHHVAEVARCLGAHVIYYSTSGTVREESYPLKTLESLLSQSDIVSIHAPLNEKTKGLLGREQLSLMKSTAILINVARGGIVDEKALAEALDNGVIAGAGLDVFEHEPIDTDNPLLKIRNPDQLILSPHSAWTSIQARKQLIEGVAQNIRDFLTD